MQIKQFPLIYFGAVDPYKDNAPIQIFKLNSMTQQDKVIKVFTELLGKGNTTTLDVKLRLRELYPDAYWTQDFVSMVIYDYQNYNEGSIQFNDNGFYRTYYLKTYTPQNDTISPVYEYLTKSGVLLKADTSEALLDTLNVLGERVHWSTTKKKFVPIDEMHENHILNVIWKNLDGLSRKEFVNFIQTSPYVQELFGRTYPSAT